MATTDTPTGPRFTRVLLALLGLCGLPLQAQDARTRPPNVLMICIDDLNDWVGCLDGNPDVITPHIDALATRGRLFSNAHCAVSVCSPSRVSILSGLPATTHGSYELGPSYQSIRRLDDVPTMHGYFKAHGYTTITGGKVLHHGFTGRLARDIDQNIGDRKGGPRPKGVLNWPSPKAWDWGAFPPTDDEMFDLQHARAAADVLGKKHEKPFFLSVGIFRPHVPMFVPPKWFDLYDAQDLTLPKAPVEDMEDVPPNFQYKMGVAPTHTEVVKAKKWRSMVHAYLASTSFVDHCVGEILKGLKDGPNRNNTIVVLWSDHGFHLGEKQHVAKRTLWEESTRVPLIMAGPGIQPGKDCREAVNLIDIYPTLVERCGLPPNKHLEGLSLSPQLGNPAAPRKQPAITSSYFGNHAIRTRDWKLIRYADGAEELYDHRSDPKEFTNLANNPKHAEMKEKLSEWLPKDAAPEVKPPAQQEQRNRRPRAAKKTSSAEPARDLDWWSLRPVNSNQLSVISKDSPITERNPIDLFIEAKLKEKGLKPAGPADPATLIRRITYDLTGLPPKPEEVSHFEEAYIQDPASSIQHLADRLLASPAFGEKFAQHWLDIARYGETHGYDKDKPRPNAWPYRDYVIRSFNDDKPYGRFVREQVAGDILYPDNPDGVLGLGFLAAGPWDFIGHSEVGEGKLDGRIAKHLDRDEMVSAVFNVFQSSTVQCAQCHHHKLDPVLMEDYYRLQTVFAAVDRADRVYEGLPPAQQRRKNEVLAKINALKDEQETLGTQVNRKLAAKVSGIDRRIAELKEKYGTGLKPQYGFHSRIEKKADTPKWVQVDLGRPTGVTELRIIPAYDKFNNIGEGFGFPMRYRVEASSDPGFKRDVRLLLDKTQGDQPNPGTQTILVEVGGTAVRHVRITATKLRERKNDYIFALGELEAVNEGGATNFALGKKVTALDTIESGTRWGVANLVDGIYFRELGNEAALAELRELQAKRKEIENSLRTPETESRLKAIAAELAPLNRELKSFPQGRLVYAAATDFPRGGRFTATGGKPRPVHLLYRGDLRTPRERMTPGAPPLWEDKPMTFFDGDHWDEAEARAELARYLTRRDNPLTWRSIANRLWQWTFGAPLVGTPNDFGRGGMQPTHPELLDHLAAMLRDDPDQSLKSVIRLLLTSVAYRRASTHDDGNAAIDTGNAYLWGAHRRRLTAEEFRDSVLAVSGALDRRMGGPSFQDFVIEKPQHSPHYEYHLHDPADPASHRRSIYRFVVRSQPQPMLTTLDCADPSMSVAQRDESTTALQALTQWNHRFVEAMARRFAQRLQNEALVSTEDVMDRACRLALGREPGSEERSVLRAHLDAHGLESFARVVLNLNAFVYVD